MVEPFKSTYAIKEIKNAISDRFTFGSSDYSKISHLPTELKMPANYSH
jgi:hypothetical protein